MDASAASTIALLRTNSLSGIVQHEIERMILAGELAPGARLNENALAAKLGVSRAPIREACRALAELGLAELIPNRGVFVRRLNWEDVLEVYDLRAGLTGLVGSLLAATITDEQIAKLCAFLKDMDAAASASDFPAFYALNLEFHDFAAQCTGNGRLLKLYRQLVKEFSLFRKHGLVDSESLAASNEEHRAIIEALAARDKQTAYDASFQHVSNGKRRMLTALDRIAADEAASKDRVKEFG